MRFEEGRLYIQPNPLTPSNHSNWLEEDKDFTKKQKIWKPQSLPSESGKGSKLSLNFYYAFCQFRKKKNVGGFLSNNPGNLSIINMELGLLFPLRQQFLQLYELKTGLLHNLLKILSYHMGNVLVEFILDIAPWVCRNQKKHLIL